MSNERVLSLTKRYAPPAFGLLLFTAAFVSHFAVLSNDSFPLLWQAKHLAFSNPASFYNGFFPIGYPALMRLAALTQWPLRTLEILQVVLAPLYLLLAISFLARFLKPSAVVLALLIVVGYPDLLRSVLCATPDFLASLAALCAYYAISRERYAIAGIALGAGLLFRSHILVLLVATVIATISIGRSGRLEIVGRIVLGALPFILLQGIVQAFSGHDFFESAQAFNVYRMMYGVDWNSPPHVQVGVLELIAGNPLQFLRGYFVNLANAAVVLLPLGLTLVVVRRDHQQEPLRALCFAALLYTLIVTVGFSPRALLPVWPCAVLGLMVMVHDRFAGVARRVPSRVAVIVMTVIGAVIAFGTLFAAHRSAERVDEYDGITHALDIRNDSEIKTIYTDDFALYFPSLHDAAPQTSGGWAEIGLPEYTKQQLHLRTTSSGALCESFRTAGLTTAIFRVPPINPTAERLASSDTTHFTLIATSRSHEIYRLQ